MGQRKGNPTPTVQQQAYMDKYGESAARTNSGTTPAMINSTTTLTAVIDSTFATDSDETTTNSRITAVSSSINTTIGAVSSSINTTILAVSGSINTTILAVSSSIDTRLNAVSQSLSSSINIPGTYANDTAAGTAGVRIGGLYHTTGTVKVRLT